MIKREWPIREFSRARVNEALYEAFDNEFAINKDSDEDLLTLRLIYRETADNIIKHDNNAFRIYAELNNGQDSYSIKIKHDGNLYDPFSASSDCTLLKARREANFSFNTQRTISENITTTYTLILRK